MANLTFVTKNLNKVSDAQKLLPEYELEHVDIEVPEIQSLDLQEIIEHKLKYAYEKLNAPCFVMDTSLFLDCLNGFPGPFIKWYYEKTVGADKTCQIAKLFNQHGCQFSTTLGYYDGNQVHYITETINGTIPTEPRGANGFQWDVIFIPEGENRTFAEMTFEEKQQYAVTRKILERFDELLKQK